MSPVNNNNNTLINFMTFNMIEILIIKYKIYA